MPFETTTFNSKLASRIFLTFVMCALIPVACLSGVFYLEITGDLENQNIKMLGHAVKSQAEALFGRLNQAEQELDLLNTMDAPVRGNPENLSGKLRDRLRLKFKNIAFVKIPGPVAPVLGVSPIDSLNLAADDVKHLADRKPLLVELNFSGSGPFIILAHFDDAGADPEGYVAAEMDPDFLWPMNGSDNLPPGAGYSVLNSAGELVCSTEPGLFRLTDFLKAETKTATLGTFEFSLHDEIYVASYSQVFLKPTYNLPHWTLVLFRAKSDVLRPIEQFKKTFQLIILGTLLLVAGLSIAQIRKSMVPVGELIKGAERIAKKDFSQEIRISSNDEFEVLARAFNQMAGKLDHSFNALSAIAEIDRAVLSTLNRDTIVKESLLRIGDCFTCDTCGLCLMDSALSFQGQVFFRPAASVQGIRSKTVEITPETFTFFQQLPAHLILGNEDRIFRGLLPEIDLQAPCTLLLPIRFNAKLVALLWLDAKTNSGFSEEIISSVRQIGDHLSIALSNAELVTELNQMSWSTLQALARTVDAKSTWTAGHSLRVTELALKIGGRLQLEPQSLEALHRGALLHDIGKVGVPSALLDKPSKLTDEEFQIVQKHPAVGAKIIEPIPSFKEIIPMVAQHHERYDGRGYPYGYAADRIHWGARILAVADVFDALASDRPYRGAMPVDQILELMQNESGRQFDPTAVRALLDVANEHTPQPQGHFETISPKVPAHENREKPTPTAPFVNSQRNSTGACTS